MKQLILILSISLLMMSRLSHAVLEQRFEECEAESQNDNIVQEVCAQMSAYQQTPEILTYTRDNIGIASSEGGSAQMQIFKDYNSGDHPNLGHALNLMPYVTTFDSVQAVFNHDHFISTLSLAVNTPKRKVLEQFKHQTVPLQFMQAKYWSVVYHVESGPYDEIFRTSRPLSSAVFRKLAADSSPINSTKALTWDKACPMDANGIPTARVYFTCPYRDDRPIWEKLFPCFFGSPVNEGIPSSKSIDSAIDLTQDSAL